MAQSLCKIYIHIIFHVKTTIPTVDGEHLERSRWIKTLSPKYEQFAWQGGYGVFSVSQSQVDTVVAYIRNQSEHHKKQSFKDEYLEFLRLYKIEYDERYVLSD